jgi:transglycosylase-like protein with SLT domain/NlpC/P60 family protein
MSVTDVTSRISQIQGQLALLGVGRTSQSGGSTFASALDGAVSRSDASEVPLSDSVAGRARVVDEARKYLGVPYVWGGTDPAKGLDCSGLVQLVYGNLGVDLPRVSRDQAQAGTAVPSLDEARPGDLVAFGSPVHHIGIYLGDNQMIEAPRPGLAVRVSEISETPTAIRRVIPDSGAGEVTTARSAGDVPYADLFDRAAATYGVDADLLAAVARQESGFNADAVSPAGAQGLMQLMPGTAQGLGVTDSFDPAQAVDGAARLLHDLTERFGSTPLALAAYNAGPGAVLRYDGIPPYPETQNYVRSIMSMLGQS